MHRHATHRRSRETFANLQLTDVQASTNVAASAQKNSLSDKERNEGNTQEKKTTQKTQSSLMFLFRNEPPVLLHFYFLGNYTARICVRMESVGSRRRQCAKRASAPRIVCPVSPVHFSGEFFLILCEFSLLVRFFFVVYANQTRRTNESADERPVGRAPLRKRKFRRLQCG